MLSCHSVHDLELAVQDLWGLSASGQHKVSNQLNADPCGGIKNRPKELHASNLYGRVGIRKPLVTARHALQRRQWCRTHRQWIPQQWQQVIWSDESTFTLFQTTGRVYVWRTPKEAFAPECIVLTVKHGGGSLMVHPFVQTSLPRECPLYQDDNAPIHTAKIVQEWFAEDEGEGHLDWPSVN
ncbi:transposable element Tcb1 transposase [Trichonephila clavipes]|nr:transposable element Tcb1 transposase [Trichonephila clavipes]